MTEPTASNRAHDTGDRELVLRPYSLISLADLADVWRYRELMWTLAERDIRVRYKQAVFGVLWALVQPLLHVVIFTLLFHRVARIQADVDVPYPLYCFCGVAVWMLFANGLGHASNSLVENSRVITKVYFPRIVVPLSSIVVAAIDFAIAFAVLIAALAIYGVPLGATAALAPAFALLAMSCAIALGLWTSAANLQYRDVRHALPFFFQLLIFVTPVFYPSSLIPERYQFVLLLNPMAGVVDGFRAALLGSAIPWDRVAIAAGEIVAIGLLGFYYFRRMEHGFADRV